MQSPERRSDADLQGILNSLIGDAGFVLSGDLPDLLIKYEIDNDLIILEPSEYDSLRSLCQEHDALELGPDELFSFLSMIPKPQKTARYPSPTPGPALPHSVSMPLSSFPFDQSTPTQPIRGHRRHSDRIKSPSDSSSTSSDEEDNRVGQHAQPVKPFPASATANQLDDATKPPVPRRVKTLSDPERLSSPLAMRSARNGKGPPSAFNLGSGSFARPSPAGRRNRRRGSSAGYRSTDNTDDEGSVMAKSPDYSQANFSRSTSNTSVHMYSAKSSDGSSPMSPVSPNGLDNTSFHLRAKSPESAQGDVESNVEDIVFGEGSEQDHGQEELEEAEDEIGQGMTGESNPRLSRISTSSVTSLRTSHDKLQMLQKQNTEITRKLKESERQLTALGADNDNMVVDLERQLEEARHELAQKRKDDKELRGNELKQTLQISGLEADLANVQRLLEQSKEHRANMQKMYDSQCDEAQRLRDLLRDRDSEIRALEEAANDHEADEEKVQELEAEVKRLETEVTVARKAESILEIQKQENLQLKETIDRMRFDLDEARAVAASGKPTHTRGSTAGSAGGTMSRNLGDEINRRLLDAQAVEEEEDTFVETVVTTRRQRKGGAKSAGSEPITVDEVVREYADAATLTDPVRVLPIIEEAGPSTQENPPAYTPDPEPIDAKAVLDRAHPRQHCGDASYDVETEYDGVAESLGLRCNVIEEAISSRRAERAKRGLAPRARSSIANYITLYPHVTVGGTLGKIAAYTLAAFAIGIVTGSHYSGTYRQAQLFDHLNDLAWSVGGRGEGILPQSAKIIGIMSSVHIGRVPT